MENAVATAFLANAVRWTEVKGKVAAIEEDGESHCLLLDVEDTLSRETLHLRFDLVVLATGVVPNTADQKIPGEIRYDRYGFVEESAETPGFFAAGCAKNPCDVARSTKESTAAALRAIQCQYGGE